MCVEFCVSSQVFRYPVLLHNQVVFDGCVLFY